MAGEIEWDDKVGAHVVYLGYSVDNLNGTSEVMFVFASSEDAQGWAEKRSVFPEPGMEYLWSREIVIPNKKACVPVVEEKG